MSDLPPAAAIADVLALWGRDGWLTPPMRPIVAPAATVAGTARTVSIGFGPSGPGLAPLYDVLDSDLAGRVLVLGGADTLPGAVWGEILATTAARNGATAVLVHGAVRDLDDLPPTPLYALGTNLVGPNGMAHVVALDAPITIGAAGVEVDHEDRIVADATGCVRVRARDADEVLPAAALYAAAEAQVVDAVRAGEPLAEAYLIKKTAVDQLRKG
jgi:regulator of RNase E activity RraA